MKVSIANKLRVDSGGEEIGVDEPIEIERTDSDEVGIHIGSGEEKQSIYFGSIAAAVVGMELITAAEKAVEASDG